jgi:hypothetical protein
MKNEKYKEIFHNTTTPKRTQEDYSTLFLIVLFAVSGFLGLLGYALGEGTNAHIDAQIASFDSMRFEPRKSHLEKNLEALVEGHPITDMIPYIAEEDHETAKFLVSIAKKESNWGKYSPKNELGETCYNYWGYRGQTESVTRSGYSCFESPQEAVAVVGKRLNYLIWDLRLDTPEELIVWKCGWSCAGHSTYGVEKWIQDVDLYVRKIDAGRYADAGK